jgi:hypothetical protein
MEESSGTVHVLSTWTVDNTIGGHSSALHVVPCYAIRSCNMVYK